MPKFSIIIPVYNVEKYIDGCLKSVMNQSYKDYEVIVVNDGTKDNSMDIVKNYDVKVIEQKNQGLSAARNTGVKHAKGDYLIFLDSDDSWNENLLEEISKSLKNNPDVVRFQIQETYEDKDEVKPFNEQAFKGKNGVEAFETITNFHFIENAWCYAIRREYYKKNKFSFKVGTIHEDYGLTPLIIIKADKVNCIEYIGYNYLQRQGSIMSNTAYEKIQKRVGDMYDHYLYLIKEINKTKLNSKVFKSYAANSILLKLFELNKEDYKKYMKRVKEDKVIDNLLSDTFGRKIKKLIVKINPSLYYKKLSK
ncbi:MAG: glycosyltransferase [Bacilli bacterium]|nr:glycosyltransferase [Bacilli bacterium]